MSRTTLPAPISYYPEPYPYYYYPTAPYFAGFVTGCHLGLGGRLEQPRRVGRQR